MRELEGLIGLVLAAVLVAAAARRVGAPYPVFLALGGALLAFLPGAPTLIVPPELALAIFIAPVLVFIYTLVFKGLIVDGWPGWCYVLQRTLAEIILSLRLTHAKLMGINGA